MRNQIFFVILLKVITFFIKNFWHNYVERLYTKM